MVEATLVFEKLIIPEKAAFSTDYASLFLYKVFYLPRLPSPFAVKP